MFKIRLDPSFGDLKIYVIQILFYLMLTCGVAVQAQLSVVVSPPQITGQKAIVQLTMENHLDKNVESARAICFLLDDKGKMAGQSIKWVIGQNKTGLASGTTNIFDFVISSPRPFETTNLAAKVSFSQVTLEKGTAAEVNRIVKITQKSQ